MAEQGGSRAVVAAQQTAEPALGQEPAADEATAQASPALPEWTFEMVGQPWSVHSRPLAEGESRSTVALEQMRRSAEARSGDSFGRGLIAGLMLSVGVVAGFVGSWWIMSRGAVDEQATAAVAVPVEAVGSEVAAVEEPEPESLSNTTGLDGSEPSGDAAPTVDPLTGEPFPTSIDGLTLDELRAGDYPRAVLTPDGGVVLRGRMGSQADIDSAVAEIEAAGGPGSATNELELTPGAPGYEIDQVFFEEIVLFAFNSTELEPEYVPVLDHAVAAFETFPTLRMTVIGRADPIGSEAINLRFSRERAQTIVDYWIAEGVSPERISLTARGAAEADDGMDDPNDPNRRRVEFSVEFD